jgi:6-phosphogluconolactonase
MPDKPATRVLDTPDDVVRVAADEFARRALARVKRAQPFMVALSGGSTPRRLFELLAGEPYRERVPWRKVHVFWGDERTVPPDDPDSNFGVAHSLLLSRVDIPGENVHRIRGELDEPNDAAVAYEAELRDAFRIDEGEFPRFDFVLLGMGADGHTASLFPGTQALVENRRLAVAPWVEKLGTHRVTLTCPVFNNAACILFLVTGAEKAETLRAVLEGEPEKPRYPAQLIRPRDGELRWLVDRAAARLITDY